MLSAYNQSIESNEPLSWFEELYSGSEKERENIPWDWKEPHPFLVEWVEGISNPGKALVVGCGLGEDASFLSREGWEVTAFDISESAVSWAKQLHEGLEINWAVADLLNLPESWNGKFDLVLEVHILQAIPLDIREQAAPLLAPLVSNGGKLVCIGRLEDGEQSQEGPPWPLTIDFIEKIGSGLEPVEIHTAIIPAKESNRYRATWEKNRCISQHQMY